MFKTKLVLSKKIQTISYLFWQVEKLSKAVYIVEIYLNCEVIFKTGDQSRFKL